MIERIRIQNYRSLHDVDVRLEPLTVLIGRSGSGKSNFVRAVRLLRDVFAGTGLQQVGATAPYGAKAPSPLRYEVELGVRGVGPLSYRLALTRPGGVEDEHLSAAGRTVFHHASGKWVVEPAVTPRPNPGGLVLGALTGVREATVAYVALARGIACYDFTGGVLQNGAALDSAPGYKGTGGTALEVAGRIVDSLERLGDWAAISKSLVALNDRLVSFDLLLPGRDQLLAGYRVADDKTLMINAAEESEGFRRYLAHLLALYQTPPKQTLVFEHPETGIHPGALSALADEFAEHVRRGRGQVILTTHSPQFLDHFGPEQVRVVEFRDGQTRIGRLADDQRESLRLNLMTGGDLLTVDQARIDPPAEVPIGAS